MKAIVAVDLNWGIGCDGKLLETIPEDKKFFKEKTIGKVVVMGRETFESLPGKAPLKDRVNIVLSRNENYMDDRLIICNSIDETFDQLKKYDKNDIFVIGGEVIYKQFLSHCEEIYVTKIKNKYSADKYFPNLDEDQNWVLVESSEDKEYKGVGYNFQRYKNRSF